MRLTNRREIARNAPQTWALLVDWERHHEWVPATTVHIDTDPPAGVGTRLRAVTGIGPLAFTDSMEIMVWEPPRRYVTRHTGRIIRGEVVFSVEPVGTERSVVTWTEDLRVPSALETPPLQWLASRASEPFFSMALGRFAKLAEA